MLNILGKKNYRLINIINQLVDKRYVGISYIAKINNCSERTVYSDLDELLFKWNRILKIRLENAVIIYERVIDTDLEYVVGKIFAEDFNVKFLLHFLHDETTDIGVLERKFSCKKIKITGAIKKVNNYLANAEAELFINKQDIKLIVKDELKFRIILVPFSRLNLIEWKHFEKYWQNREIRDYIYSAFSNSIFINYFIKHLANITLFRIGSQNPEITKKEIETQLFETIAFFSYKSKNGDNDLKKKCSLMVEHIESIFNLNLNDEERLNEITLIYQVLSQINIIKKMKISQINRITYFVKQYSREHYQIFMKFANEVNAFIDTSYNKNALIHELLFYVFSEVVMNKEPRVYKFLIYSDLGMNHLNILKSYFSRNFPNYKFDCIEAFEESADYSQYDFVISTISCLGMCKKKLNVITVADYPDKDDILKICSVLEFN